MLFNTRAMNYTPLGFYCAVKYTNFDLSPYKNIENLSNINDIHTTIIYDESSTFFNVNHHINHVIELDYYNKGIKINNPNYEIFGENTLVISFESVTLQKRHNYLKTKYNFTHPYPAYNPHITLSTEFKGDINNLPILKPFILNCHEYYERLKD